MHTFADAAIGILSFPAPPRALHKNFLPYIENWNTLFYLIYIFFKWSLPYEIWQSSY